MGLPGSGKTTLARQLSERLPAVWYNDIEISNYFTESDSLEQASRMGILCDIALRNRVVSYAIADFVCPTEQTRKTFNPDYIIWMNTVKESKHPDTDKVFEKPDFYNVEITSWNYDCDNIFGLIKLHDR